MSDQQNNHREVSASELLQRLDQELHADKRDKTASSVSSDAAKNVTKPAKETPKSSSEAVSYTHLSKPDTSTEINAPMDVFVSTRSPSMLTCQPLSWGMVVKSTSRSELTVNSASIDVALQSKIPTFPWAKRDMISWYNARSK